MPYRLLFPASGKSSRSTPRKKRKCAPAIVSAMPRCLCVKLRYLCPHISCECMRICICECMCFICRSKCTCMYVCTHTHTHTLSLSLFLSHIPPPSALSFSVSLPQLIKEHQTKLQERFSPSPSPSLSRSTSQPHSGMRLSRYPPHPNASRVFLSCAQSARIMHVPM